MGPFRRGWRLVVAWPLRLVGWVVGASSIVRMVYNLRWLPWEHARSWWPYTYDGILHQKLTSVLGAVSLPVGLQAPLTAQRHMFVLAFLVGSAVRQGSFASSELAEENVFVRWIVSAAQPVLYVVGAVIAVLVFSIVAPPVVITCLFAL